MKHEIEIDEAWVIPEGNFCAEYIESRLQEVPPAARPFLRSTLNYLYLEGGAKTLDRERLVASQEYLSAAERLVARWLNTRSNGSERKNYGSECVVAAKAAKHRCNRCRYPDVRALHLDHVHGRSEGVKKEFECLCANCHMRKSREKDWEKPSTNTSLGKIKTA